MSTTSTATTTVDKASIIASVYSALSADLSASSLATASTTTHFTDAQGSTWALAAAVTQNAPEPSRSSSTGPTVIAVTAYGPDDAAASTYTTTVLPRCTGSMVTGIGAVAGSWWNAGMGDDPAASVVAGTVFRGVAVWVALRAVLKGAVGLRRVVWPGSPRGGGSAGRARVRARDGDAAATAGEDEKEREEEREEREEEREEREEEREEREEEREEGERGERGGMEGDEEGDGRRV